jgi:hypothetical protein
LDKSCIETESKGSNPDVNNIIKSCFSDRITPSLPNLGTNELKVGVTVFSDLGQTFQVIVKDLATLQSDSFRVTNDAPTVKTFEIPIGHPYSVEVGFYPTVTSIEWHFRISNCLAILGFTCLGIMTTSPQLVFVNISAP